MTTPVDVFLVNFLVKLVATLALLWFTWKIVRPALGRNAVKRVEQKNQWIIALTPLALGIIAQVWLQLSIIGFVVLIVSIVVSISIIAFSWVEVAADPPHVAIATVWGEPVDKVEKAGLKLYLNFFPFLYGLIKILMEKRNPDFKFTVRCRLEADQRILTPAEDEAAEEEDERSPYERLRDIMAAHAMAEPQSGGEVEVVVGMSWEPNSSSKERLLRFVQAGRDQGITDIITEVIGEDLRQLGRKLAWVHMNFATDLISALLVYALTGEQVHKLEVRTVEEGGKRKQKLVRDSEGKPKKTGERCHPLEASEAECKHYLETILTNGLPDVRDLGIVIRRINVAQVKAVGELAKDAEQGARERQQRARQREQLATRHEGVKYIRDNMEIPDTVTDVQLWDYLLVEEAIVPRTIKDVRLTSEGKNHPLTDAATILDGVGGGS